MLNFKIIFAIIGICTEFIGVSVCSESNVPSKSSVSSESNQTAEEFMRERGIMTNNGPKEFLKTIFDGISITEDNYTLTYEQTRSRPKFEWTADPEALHTLVMVDIDMYDDKDRDIAMFINYMVVNIPGSNVDKGQQVVAYVGPLPRDGLDYNSRIVVLVFKQKQRREVHDSEKITIISRDLKNRLRDQSYLVWNKYDRTNYDAPVAGNVFIVPYAKGSHDLQLMIEQLFPKGQKKKTGKRCRGEYKLDGLQCVGSMIAKQIEANTSAKKRKPPKICTY